MNEILGFIVLTSPLFIILIWLPICFLIAIWLCRNVFRLESPLKIFVGILVFAVLFTLPFTDEIAGRIYFNHLCESEAGATIYQPIELSPENWKADGTPKFYKGANNNDVPSYAFDRLGIEFEAEWVEKKRLLNVTQHGSVIKEKKSGKRYSEVVGFWYKGGWINRKLTPHPSGISCNSANYYDDLVRQQFIPTNAE